MQGSKRPFGLDWFVSFSTMDSDTKLHMVCEFQHLGQRYELGIITAV